MEQNHNQNNKKEDIDINIPQIPLWTVNYLAEFLTMNKQTIRNFIRDGKISIVKVGKSVRIPRDEVVRMVGKLITRKNNN